MSRIGKKTVQIPQGVAVHCKEDRMYAKGKLGELSILLHADVVVELTDKDITFAPANDSKKAHQLWGTLRNNAQNLVTGVHEGFSVDLEINGVGYRAAVQGQKLTMQLGYSHEILFDLPQDIKATCAKPTEIKLHGADKQRVGQAAAKIRSFRPPEPFKGKGVKYKDEVIIRKEGKKK